MSVSDEGEEFLRTAVSDGEVGTSLPSPDKGGPVSNEMGYLENPREDRCLMGHLHKTGESRCLMKWDTAITRQGMTDRCLMKWDSHKTGKSRCLMKWDTAIRQRRTDRCLMKWNTAIRQGRADRFLMKWDTAIRQEDGGHTLKGELDEPNKHRGPSRQERGTNNCTHTLTQLLFTPFLVLSCLLKTDQHQKKKLAPRNQYQ